MTTNFFLNNAVTFREAAQRQAIFSGYSLYLCVVWAPLSLIHIPISLQCGRYIHGRRPFRRTVSCRVELPDHKSIYLALIAKFFGVADGNAGCDARSTEG